MPKAILSLILLSFFSTTVIGQTNMSFESPSLSGAPGFQTIGIGTSASGFNTAGTWIVTQGSVDVVRPGASGYAAWTALPADGNNVIDLSGAQRGVIEQTVTLPPNFGGVTLAFNYSRNLDHISGAGTFNGRVEVLDGSNNVLFTDTFFRVAATDGATASNFNWSTYTAPSAIAVPGSTVKIRFTDFTDVGDIGASAGIVLDNILFVPVPEPTTVLGLTAVFVLAGRYAGKRLRKKSETPLSV